MKTSAAYEAKNKKYHHVSTLLRMKLADFLRLPLPPLCVVAWQVTAYEWLSVRAVKHHRSCIVFFPRCSIFAGRPLWQVGGSCTDAQATTTSSQVQHTQILIFSKNRGSFGQVIFHGMSQFCVFLQQLWDSCQTFPLWLNVPLKWIIWLHSVITSPYLHIV